MKMVVGNQHWQRAASCYVRMQVFVLEGAIALEDEFDDLDLPETVYGVLYHGQEPVATGRFIQENQQIARFTRIATLQNYRGQKLGTQIIHGLEEYARQSGYNQAKIHAEVSAIDFYQKLGYEVISAVYYEDQVPCQTLARSLV